MATSSSRLDAERDAEVLKGLPTDSISQPGILVVDDDSFALALQSRMLRTMGYQKVCGAASGTAALELLRDDPTGVDVIVCDMQMPHMDGIEFLQIVNTSSFRGSVILLSGQGARIMHSVQKLLSGGRLVILGALDKPARRAALGTLLDRWKPGTAVEPADRPARQFTPHELQQAQDELQWVLNYQPKVNLKTGVVLGMEALARWNRGGEDLVHPADFIGRLEEIGAIDALTDWVLQTAFAQQAQWKSEGFDGQMAVNVSMDSLRSPGFVGRICGFAQAAGVSPTGITLEVSENRLLSLQGPPLESLIRLRLQGFGLSLDDFGTGHSSLTQLRDLPFTELKVDISFVQQAGHNQIVLPILEGSIGISQRLGLQSVAEGVESEEDWHLLRGIGCDCAQGYFIGRPMAAGEAAGWLTQWQQRGPRLVGKQAGNTPITVDKF